MRYIKTFAVTAPLFAIFYHVITANGPYPIRWWPDSAIMGFFMGIAATVVVARFRVMVGPNLRRKLRSLFSRSRAPEARRDQE